MQAIFCHDDAMGYALADRFLNMDVRWTCIDLALSEAQPLEFGSSAMAPWLVMRVTDETRASKLPARLASVALAGVTVVDMSPGSIEAAKAIQAQVESQGGQYVDALCTGGLSAARSGSLNLLVGSSPIDFEVLRPLFAAVASQVSHVGAPGAGHVARMANQMLVGLSIAAVAETFHFVQGQGADPEVIRQALLLGGATSNVLKVHGQRMLEGAAVVNYPIAAHHRDLQLVLRSAQASGTSLPQTQGCERLFGLGVSMQIGDLDHSALHRVASSPPHSSAASSA